MTSTALGPEVGSRPSELTAVRILDVWPAWTRLYERCFVLSDPRRPVEEEEVEEDDEAAAEALIWSEERYFGLNWTGSAHYTVTVMPRPSGLRAARRTSLGTRTAHNCTPGREAMASHSKAESAYCVLTLIGIIPLGGAYFLYPFVSHNSIHTDTVDDMDIWTYGQLAPLGLADPFTSPFGALRLGWTSSRSSSESGSSSLLAPGSSSSWTSSSSSSTVAFERAAGASATKGVKVCLAFLDLLELDGPAWDDISGGTVYESRQSA